MVDRDAPTEDRIATGIPGLDDAVGGGFIPNRLYLLEGDSGTGKTTMGLQFLLEGVRHGEAGLYVTLSETKNELVSVAASHGWSLDGISVHELATAEDLAEADQTIFHSSEVELGETKKSIVADIERLNPARIVLDALPEVRLMAQNPLRFRREIVGLKQFFAARNTTVLLIDEQAGHPADPQLRSLVHGVFRVEQVLPHYGANRRQLSVIKMRASTFLGGYHDCVIRKGGIVVFPRMVPAEDVRSVEVPALSSGLVGLDELVGGGLDGGSSTLIVGPAGAGKSVLASQYASASAQRGENVAYFTFDEAVDTLAKRADAIGLGFQQHMDAGRIAVQKIDPAERSPGEFVNLVHRVVSDKSARLVIVDSLNGYLNAMPAESILAPQLHQLLAFLAQKGVATILVMGESGVYGAGLQTAVDVSYIADTVIVLRLFEAAGRVRRAISIAKRRGGAHEDAIREYRIERAGIQIGKPLEEFRGVLTGVPTYVGMDTKLIGGAEQ